MKPKSSRVWIAILCAWSASLGAQVPPPATPTAPVVTTSDGKETPAQTKIISSFTAFAGSEENARSLVTGLRQGSEITLTAPAPGGTPGTGTGGTTTPGTEATFTPQTRPMGYGNVRIALSLAREQLAQQGITQPTPAQIQAALVGTPITGTSASTGTTTPEVRGILQMRADGMGWGQIANSMGVKLGQVMSGRTPPATVTAATGTTAGTTSTSTGTGITTAAGATSASVATSRGNSAAAHVAQKPGAGIVTAAGGGSVATGLGAGARGGGSAAATGVVTASGANSGGQASSQGRGLAKGHVNP